MYTAVIEQEISSSTQAVNRAAFEGKQAVETAKMDSGEAAKALKVAVMGSLKVSVNPNGYSMEIKVCNIRRGV